MAQIDISTCYTPPTEFEAWLECITTEYKNLSDEQRNQTLQSLIEASCSTQLCYLQSKIEILVYRDFFRLLPPDVTEYLLLFLDPRTLLNCCQVSSAWNTIVSTDARLWYRACKDLELKVNGDKNVYPAHKWKRMFIDMAALLNKMKNSKCFKSTRYLGHSIRVTAVFYWNNRIATGSDDHTVRIWNCISDMCISIIPTECSVSRIKFDDNILILGSYGGFLKSFSFKTRQVIQNFHQHTAAVFCLDFKYKMDLLVSGGADDTIRVWSIKNGASLSTVHGHEHWVISVLIVDPGDENNLNKSILLISMDRQEIRVWNLSPPSDFTCDQRIQTSITNINFVTPGVHCDGERVYFIKQDPGSVTLLCCWNLDQKKMEFERELDFKVKILLGVGKKYFCLVTPSQENAEKPNFLVCSIKYLKPIVRWYIPPSRASSPGNSQMILGEYEWLNGLDGANPEGVIFATGLDDCSYYILKWNHEIDNTSKDSYVTALSRLN